MLTNEQNKDLEIAIFEYLKEKEYKNSANNLISESKFSENLKNHEVSNEKLLERKWLTIIKLQSKIVELEQKLKSAEEIISKSVRHFKNVNQDENQEETALTHPVLKLNKVYKGHKDVINSVSIHRTEPIFATGSGDTTIRLFDYELQESITVLKGHTHSVNSVSWADNSLISGSSDMSIKIWKSANKTNEHDFKEFFCLKTLLGHDHAVSFIYNIPETEITVSCSRDKTIRFWDRSTTYCKRTLNEYHEEWVRCCDSNDKYFISSGNDKKIFVFGIEHLLNFDNTNKTIDCINSFEVHDNYVEAIKVFQKKFADLEAVCVTASRDKTIKIWNYLLGTELLTFIGHDNWVKDIFLYEEYDLLFSVGEDKTIRIWNVKKKKQVYCLNQAHDHFIATSDLHKEFKIFLTGSVDKTAKVWKLSNSTSDDLLNSISTI
jgi:platelet-activating factor acetylhydrolase IB subunit alpha